MTFKVRGVVECDHWDCGEQCPAREEVLAEVQTRDVAGDVVGSIDPALPKGWGYSYGSLYCPAHLPRRR